MPNIFTTIGLCTGLTGLRYALDSNWEKAVICILAAACFDLIDGLSARLLKAFSRFGAELDSLADAISFGVAPTIILFLWIRESLELSAAYEVLGWYWIPFLLYTMCCAFRLARFNITSGEGDQAKKNNSNFFVGVPAPAGAALVLLPMTMHFAFDRLELDFYVLEYSNLLLGWVSLIAALMISTIPTFSIRSLRFRISTSKALPVLLAVCLIVAIFIKEMWITLMLFGVLYFISLPITFYLHRKDS